MTVASQDALKSLSGEYVPYLVALLYCVFDPVAGPTVVSQVPEGSVATRLSTFPDAHTRASSSDNNKQRPSSTSRQQQQQQRGTSSSPARNAVIDSNTVSKQAEHVELNSTKVLFDFSSILDFVIPKPELCGHLITKATRTSKILGFPVRIVDEDKYHKGKEVYNRNTFTFNVCFVFERDAELSAFEPIVRKLGRTLRQVEETSSLLSSPPPTFHIADLLEQIFMDINNYSETSIKIGDTDLELFLLPYFANPPKIHNWDVPVAVTPLESLKDPSWDVTLFKICTFINGVNHVKRIAELAEVDLHLARLCVQHLVYYGAVIMVDLFQYSNCYTALPAITEVSQFGEEDDEGVTDLRTEAEAYVYSPTSIPSTSTNSTADPSSSMAPSSSGPVPFASLLAYAAQLRAGLTVSSWIDANDLDSKPIDIRRFIQFGVIKGFLRRVHAYPIWLDHPSLSIVAPQTTTFGDEGATAVNDLHNGLTRRNSSSMPELRTLPSQTQTKLNLSSSSQDNITSARPAQLDRNPSSFLSTNTNQAADTSSSSSSTGGPQLGSRNQSNLDMRQQLDSYQFQTSQPQQPSILSAPKLIAHSASSDKVKIDSNALDSNITTSQFLSNSRVGGGGGGGGRRSYPASLPLMLDGKHHTDEICIKYGVTLRQLEIVLREIGNQQSRDRHSNYDDSEVDSAIDEEDDEDDVDNGGLSGHMYGSRVVMLYV
ncbi:Nitrogen permease regulator 2 [Microbotryomycetes sp. JL221]|nr:Nitrogen permease regulator 2 [Microbotryomycetes sp. JL221]